MVMSRGKVSMPMSLMMHCHCRSSGPWKADEKTDVLRFKRVGVAVPVNTEWSVEIWRGKEKQETVGLAISEDYTIKAMVEQLLLQVVCDMKLDETYTWQCCFPIKRNLNMYILHWHKFIWLMYSSIVTIYIWVIDCYKKVIWNRGRWFINLLGSINHKSIC